MSPIFRNRFCRRGRSCLRFGLFMLVVVAAGCNARAPAPASGDYLFCFWNSENFFDNKVNGWHNEADKDFDRWFADNKAVFAQKVKNLTEVLASLNDGRGPDILALAEVEADSTAAETLMDSLNKAIKPEAPPYRHLLMKNPHGGRNIATAILTRLPVVADRTQLIGKRHRILEGHIEVEGRDLAVLASHWTSRVSDKVGEGRDKYADQIYGRFRAMHKAKPDVSLLICGDFNDNPDDASVTKNLHATGDLNQVQANGDPPLLYDLFANLWAEKKSAGAGTHFYRGKAFLFDHLVVSPGMVDGRGGWQCLVETAEIVKHRFIVTRGRNTGHPLEFGTEKEKVPLAERGVSDHLPVTVRLRIH
ncbi:MAG TPA: endonuclease/exonuclease/phosphatase family protein [Gemmataceae bacterium]|nr:endonuclease/exonuclease/phosphatase family protein [Gemmataceae bacterium]